MALQARDREQPFDAQAAVEAFRSPAPSGAAPVASRPRATAAAGTAGASASAPVASATPRAPRAPQRVPAARTSAPAAAQRDVEPGVYRYATQGSEQVDALGGARHDYPDSTTITYRRTGCGTEERWQPLEGRVGVTQQCEGPGGTELRGTYQEREFFGQSQSKAYACSPGVLLRPRTPRPGATWTGSCRSDDSTIALSVRVVALEELDVGGTAVPVVRVQVEGVLSGSTRGRSDRELWLRVQDGLLVQAVGATDTDADTPAGTVRYQEDYRLRLQSLTPLR